jgi:site-specific DNA-cytosine methylase
MGQTDETFDLAQVHQSNSTLYHQAGDSIVVNVLETILKPLIKERKGE